MKVHQPPLKCYSPHYPDAAVVVAAVVVAVVAAAAGCPMHSSAHHVALSAACCTPRLCQRNLLPRRRPLTTARRPSQSTRGDLSARVMCWVCLPRRSSSFYKTRLVPHVCGCQTTNFQYSRLRCDDRVFCRNSGFPNKALPAPPPPSYGCMWWTRRVAFGEVVSFVQPASRSSSLTSATPADILRAPW